MMPARAVHMPVLHFLGCGCPHVDDLHVEMQRLVGERMVSVQCHHVAHDGRHREHTHAAVGARLELHALADLARVRQRAPRHPLDQCLIAYAIALGWSDRYLHVVAALLAFQGHFQSGDQVAMTLYIGERFTAR